MLTIAIPTYNRPKHLDKQLKTLVRIDGFSRVKLLVSDNGEDDRSERVCKKYIRRYKNIAYIRNQFNIGFDANLQKLYNYSRTKYIWFLSDDDDVFLDDYYTIFYVLDHFKPDLLCVNSFGSRYRPSYENCVYSLCEGKQPMKQIYTGENIAVNGDDALRMIAIKLCGQISSCLIKKNVRMFDGDTSKYGGIGHVYFANINLLNGNGIFHITRKPVVRQGPKDELSKWFLESCFYGVKRNLEQPEMLFSSELVDLYVFDIVRLALLLIEDSLSGRSHVSISPDFDYKNEISKLIKFHKDNIFHDEIEFLAKRVLCMNRSSICLNSGFIKHSTRLLLRKYFPLVDYACHKFLARRAILR
ncbi:glycosyltransferase [Candidatus Parcubacteria bacterium]|nr:MAG: glycosyltransferase [Candidatus Parcubacteria bacterium]